MSYITRKRRAAFFDAVVVTRKVYSVGFRAGVRGMFYPCKKNTFRVKLCILLRCNTTFCFCLFLHPAERTHIFLLTLYKTCIFGHHHSGQQQLDGNFSPVCDIIIKEATEMLKPRLFFFAPPLSRCRS